AAGLTARRIETGLAAGAGAGAAGAGWAALAGLASRAGAGAAAFGLAEAGFLYFENIGTLFR
ncbi:hypothetical protein, partial [Sulfitobacter sp. HI0054]|uniref:hypothetical protein n=1 Tax=Sulfitobacter sp. HI0054 TaxID=1822238 RepID=UPI000AC29550